MKATSAAVLVLALIFPSLAFGQGILQLPTRGKSSTVPLVKEAATSITPTGGLYEHFLALDLFAGAVGNQTQDEKKNEWPERWGWDTGATVSLGVRWLGITGAFGRHRIDSVSTYQFVAGPQLQTKWTEGSGGRWRFFTEFLVGVARSTGDAPPQSSLEWILGLGGDFYFFRMKVEHIWMDLNGLHRDNYRFFVGGVVPLCLRACEDSDLILSGR